MRVFFFRVVSRFWRFLKNLNFCARDGLGFIFETLNNSQTMHKEEEEEGENKHDTFIE